MFIDILREKKAGEREGDWSERETSMVASHTLLDQRSNLQPGHVPWPGIEPETFLCMGQHSNQLRHLTRDLFHSSKMALQAKYNCEWNGIPGPLWTHSFANSGNITWESCLLVCRVSSAGKRHHSPLFCSDTWDMRDELCIYRNDILKISVQGSQMNWIADEAAYHIHCCTVVFTSELWKRSCLFVLQERKNYLIVMLAKVRDFFRAKFWTFLRMLKKEWNL